MLYLTMQYSYANNWAHFGSEHMQYSFVEDEKIFKECCKNTDSTADHVCIITL